MGSCDHSELTVATSHDGEHGVKTLVHTPRALQAVQNRPCLIYAHGGGGVAGKAEQVCMYDMKIKKIKQVQFEQKLCSTFR